MGISVKYNRLPGYPQESITWTGAEAVDKIQCDWEDRLILAQELLGYTVGGIAHPPHQYEEGGAEFGGLYALDVSIAPLMSLGETGNYSKAELTVRYGTYSLVTESLEPSSEFITLSHEGLYWSPGQQNPLTEAAEGIRMILRRLDWVYTVHRVLYLPDWVWTHPGCVNNGLVYSRTFYKWFAAETLLCGNPSLSREITSEGSTAWSITVRFCYQPAGWNNFPRTDLPGYLNFYPIYDSAGYIKKFYPLAFFGLIVT